MSAWISVEDKLPDEGKPCLVISKKYPNQISAALIAYDDGWHWETHNGYFALNDVESYEWDDDYEFTHWQPLPPPPED